MKKKDLIVLSILRKDCRMSLTDISRKTKIPISTLYDKLKMFDKSIIKKRAAILDFSKLGYVVKTHMVFAVDRSQKDEFSNFMQISAHVNSLYKINNGYDYMAEMLHRDLYAMEKFMDELNSRFKIKEKKVFFIIDELKKEEFLSDESLIDYDFS